MPDFQPSVKAVCQSLANDNFWVLCPIFGITALEEEICENVSSKARLCRVHLRNVPLLIIQTMEYLAIRTKTGKTRIFQGIMKVGLPVVESIEEIQVFEDKWQSSFESANISQMARFSGRSFSDFNIPGPVTPNLYISLEEKLTARVSHISTILGCNVGTVAMATMCAGLANSTGLIPPDYTRTFGKGLCRFAEWVSWQVNGL